MLQLSFSSSYNTGREDDSVNAVVDYEELGNTPPPTPVCELAFFVLSSSLMHVCFFPLVMTETHTRRAACLLNITFLLIAVLLPHASLSCAG